LLKWAIAGEGIRCKFVAIVIEYYSEPKLQVKMTRLMC
jgi:hypothetical protein